MRRNRLFFAEFRKSSATGRGFDAPTRLCISQAVLASLAANGVGVRITDGALQPPANYNEVLRVKAFMAVLASLDEQAARVGMVGELSPLSRKFRSVGLASADEQSAYVAELGLHVCLWLRNLTSHIWFATDTVREEGLSAAVVVDAVRAGAEALAEGDDSAFAIGLDGVLYSKGSEGAGVP